MSRRNRACKLSATSRPCRARGMYRTTRHTDRQTGSAEDRRLASRVSAWQAQQKVARHARHPRSILAKMSPYQVCRQGGHEDANKMLRGNCFRRNPALIRKGLFTPDALPYALHYIVAPRGAAHRIRCE